MPQRSVLAQSSSGYSILVEPARIVGRTTTCDEVDIETDRMLERILGGYLVYFSDRLPFHLDLGQGWKRIDNLVVVEPYRNHRIRRCKGLRTILIEPESVCPAFMKDVRWVAGSTSYYAWVARMEQGFLHWLETRTIPGRTVDEMVFGENLPGRKLDPRISEVIAQISGSSHGPQLRVEALAARVGLSPSRVSHLFREQLDIPIRSFRAWKRIRNAMALTLSEPILLHAALEAGYADEAHFSRSMRKYFGQHANLMRRHWRGAMTFRGMDRQHGVPTLDPAA